MTTSVKLENHRAGAPAYTHARQYLDNKSMPPRTYLLHAYTRFGTSPLGNNCIGTLFIYKATLSGRLGRRGSESAATSWCRAHRPSHRSALTSTAWRRWLVFALGVFDPRAALGELLRQSAIGPRPPGWTDGQGNSTTCSHLCRARACS